MERLRHIREQAGYSQQDLADESGVSQHTISEIELGRRRPQGRTLRKLAKVLDVQVADLLGGSKPPLGPTAPSQQPTLNGELKEEQRAAREADVRQAQHLRETGRARMQKALSGWRASKERQEPYISRRKYLDEMGDLLQEVNGAEVELGQWYIKEAIAPKGSSNASVPRFLQEQARATRHFYNELRDLVASAGLSIRTGDDAKAARHAAETGPGAEPHSVEEPEAA